jgi:hypothetical protein
MAREAPKRLTAEEAKKKAKECRDLAETTTHPGQWTMLEHMAETWERVASALENGG